MKIFKIAHDVDSQKGMGKHDTCEKVVRNTSDGGGSGHFQKPAGKTKRQPKKKKV